MPCCCTQSATQAFGAGSRGNSWAKEHKGELLLPRRRQRKSDKTKEQHEPEKPDPSVRWLDRWKWHLAQSTALKEDQ